MNAPEVSGWLDVTRLILELLTLGLLLWAALSARSSAKAAFRATQATERATLAQLISELMKEYGSAQMHAHGVKIFEFARKSREEKVFPKRIPHSVAVPSDPELAELDHARRYIEQFHIRVHALYRLGLIDDEATRAIVSEFDVKILLRENLVPMLELDEHFERSRFYATIPLWEKLYGVELLGYAGSTSWQPSHA